MKVAPLLLLLLAATPVAAVPTTLHWHLADGFHDGVLSLQAPPADWTALSHIPALIPDPCVEASGTINRFSYNTWSSFTSVSGVFYEEHEGRPVLQGSLGLARPVILGDRMATLHWYLATVTDSESMGRRDVLAVPNVVVDVRILQGTFDPDAGRTLLATGRSGPALLADDATTGAEHHMAGDLHVYGFEVPVSFTLDTIDPGTLNAYGAGDGLLLDVTVSHDVPCPNGGLQTSTVAAYSAEGLRPRLDLDVRSTFEAPILGAQWVGDDLVAYVEPRSAWGKYDLGNATVELSGPVGSIILTPAVMRPRFHEHTPQDLHFGAGPVPVVFVWNEPDPPAGLYTLTARTSDLAGMTVVATHAFGVAEEKDSPAPGAVALAGLLGLILWRRRR